MGDVRRLAGRDAFQRGQDAGVEPLGRDGRELRQLLGPGGQQKVALFCSQRFCRLLCALKDETVFRQRTGRAQQAEVSYPAFSAAALMFLVASTA